MKVISQDLFYQLHQQALESPRLRINNNLHDSLDDKVQRLLNALEPGTVFPIHRHQKTAETHFLLQGKMRIVFYNDKKEITDSFLLNPKEGTYGIHIPAGQWHSMEVLESCVDFGVKEGPYAPLSEDDILN